MQCAFEQKRVNDTVEAGNMAATRLRAASVIDCMLLSISLVANVRAAQIAFEIRDDVLSRHATDR